MILYNISFNTNDLQDTYYPIIPDTCGDSENKTIKRVCLADSVEHCMQAIAPCNRHLKTGNNFILRSVDSNNIKRLIKPSELVAKGYVKDALENNEYWSLDAVKFILREYEIVDFETEFDIAWTVIKYGEIMKVFVR